MKRNLIYIFIAAAFLCGCTTPESRKQAVEKKKEQKQEQLSTNRIAQVRQGAGMSDAALHIIRKNPNPTIYDDVATMSLETSLFAFQAADVMPPSYELLKYRAMVEDLISTNAAIKTAASNQLVGVQRKLADTERREQSLTGDLAKLQEKLDKVNAANAEMANKWSALKRYVWWIIYGFIGVFIFRILAAVLPPPYNSAFYLLDHLIGGAAKLVFSVFSKAKDAAGLVEKKAHDLSEETLRQVVTAVQKVRNTSPDAKAMLDSALMSETEQNSTRVKIAEIKKDLA